MSEFAKSVAKELDRRHRRRRTAIFGSLLLLVALGAMYLRCGPGFGLGGWGPGGEGSATVKTETAPRRCQLRLAATGLTIDGKPGTRDEAVAACKAVGADLVITGDAREGDVHDLRDALDAVHVPVYVRAPR